jgi:hypothetical protein
MYRYVALEVRRESFYRLLGTRTVSLPQVKLTSPQQESSRETIAFSVLLKIVLLISFHSLKGLNINPEWTNAEARVSPLDHEGVD